jgi:hypothetical protein
VGTTLPSRQAQFAKAEGAMTAAKYLKKPTLNRTSRIVAKTLLHNVTSTTVASHPSRPIEISVGVIPASLATSASAVMARQRFIMLVLSCDKMTVVMLECWNMCSPDFVGGVNDSMEKHLGALWARIDPQERLDAMEGNSDCPVLREVLQA